MNNELIIVCVALLCLTAFGGICLATGHDGTLATAVIAGLVGIASYKLKGYKDQLSKKDGDKVE